MCIELVRGIVDCCDIELQHQSYNSEFRYKRFLFCVGRILCITSLQHFSLISDHTIITVPYSKCDQYRRSDSVCVATSSAFRYCPVLAAREYTAILQYAEATDDTLVLQSVSVRDSGSPVLWRVASRATQLRKFLACLVSDPRQYTLYSFRASGATFAANFTIETRDQLKVVGCRTPLTATQSRRLSRV
jgi:hypothetical protein